MIFDGKKVHFVYKYNNIDLSVKVYSLLSHCYKTGFLLWSFVIGLLTVKTKVKLFKY